MTQTDSEQPPASAQPLVDYYSHWKTMGILLFAGAITVCPLLPGFSQNLTYTAFFYTPAMFPILIVCCLIMGLLTMMSLPLLARAITKRPAIEIYDDRVRFHSIRAHEFRLDTVQELTGPQFGNLVVQCSTGKQFTLPLWLYRNPDKILSALRLERA